MNFVFAGGWTSTGLEEAAKPPLAPFQRRRTAAGVTVLLPKAEPKKKNDVRREERGPSHYVEGAFFYPQGQRQKKVGERFLKGTRATKKASS